MSRGTWLGLCRSIQWNRPIVSLIWAAFDNYLCLHYGRFFGVHESARNQALSHCQYHHAPDASGHTLEFNEPDTLNRNLIAERKLHFFRSRATTGANKLY